MTSFSSHTTQISMNKFAKMDGNAFFRNLSSCTNARNCSKACVLQWHSALYYTVTFIINVVWLEQLSHSCKIREPCSAVSTITTDMLWKFFKHKFNTRLYKLCPYESKFPWKLLVNWLKHMQLLKTTPLVTHLSSRSFLVKQSLTNSDTH